MNYNALNIYCITWCDCYRVAQNSIKNRWWGYIFSSLLSIKWKQEYYIFLLITLCVT